MLVLGVRGKPEYLGKNVSEESRERTILNPHMVVSRGLNPGHIGGKRVLSPLHQPSSPKNLWHFLLISWIRNEFKDFVFACSYPKSWVWRWLQVTGTGICSLAPKMTWKELEKDWLHLWRFLFRETPLTTIGYELIVPYQYRYFLLSSVVRS